MKPVLRRLLQRLRRLFRRSPAPPAEVLRPDADGRAPVREPPIAIGPGRWSEEQATLQGRSMPYRLYLPPAPSPGASMPRSLVLMLHGCKQDAQDFATGTRMNALAASRNVVVVYPEQRKASNSHGCWNWFKPQHQQRGRGEPAMLAALAQSVAAAHEVPASRLYVAGLSAGGAMAAILGECYPDVFAAVGVHSGLPRGAAHHALGALSAMRGRPECTPTAANTSG
jgi:poly(hydroxyalkanoate) depolymerase family esterase